MPQICVKYNKKVKPWLAYKYNLAINLNDYFFLTKSLILNPRYKLLLYYFDCKNTDKNNDCLGQLISENIIDTNQTVLVEQLKAGLYGIEVGNWIN